ncbi:ribokinase [bacterium]|nr:ribokinase [Rubripirellula sp.]MDA7873831.1 ribokinase [Rhodopirellula sp.]MDB4540138.1 ribokinase [bacterium]MDB4645046.1 ribokinase [Rubripirellula sp.]
MNAKTLNGPHAPRITVLGSINMDLVVRCTELPLAGQTLLAQSSSEFCGGKGANQAVAAALSGGEVSMLGAVGDDAFATRLINNLRMHGVNCDSTTQHDGVASGLAIIAVDLSGQNSIMVVPGANSKLSKSSVQAAETLLKGSDCLMIQLETPIESVLEGIRLARRYGVRVILDPAPAPSEIVPSLLQVDLICPNETEASDLTQMPVTNAKEAKAAAKQLQDLGAKNVVITMGSEGAILRQGETTTLIPAIPVDAIDTTAAGDAFAGALAVRWSQTNNLLNAVRYANAAGAIAASRAGAQTSIATQKEIEATNEIHSK